MTVTLDPWLGMSFGAQALRQRASRDEASLLGALGVGAEPLPHQMETVERILTAPEIRHLIADEVGLGKTVQSLMIVNALRLADPNHRTLVMAPDKPLEQWASEFSARCNVSPVTPEEGETDADHENAPVWLIRPDRILEGGFLDWAIGHFDLLIIDEPQTLTQEQHTALASKDRNALLPRRFPSVLLLSATPGFGNPRMRRQVLRLIEPDRADTALLGEETVAAMIAEDESRARHALMAGEGDPALHWTAQSLERRLCRWTRTDWPEITPERVVRRLTVAPFAGEETLAETATRLLRRPAEDAARRLQLIRRAQRLHRRGSPAREAIRELNLPYPFDQNDQGDTRFDALLDRLLAIWEDDAEARVVIVVGDNPTIDRLTPRLQRYFPEAGPVAQVRRSQSVETESRAIAESFDQLDGYRSGASRLLLIGDGAVVGLNLHYGTREIIFYSCPWTIREVDQLTGRIDRLAKGAERHVRTKKRRREIGVSVIGWQDSPESRVIEALDRLGVFKQPRAPVSEETQTAIDADLYACAKGEDHRAAFDRLSSLAAENLFDLTDPVLAHANPHHRGRAAALYGRIEAANIPGALPSAHPETGGARVEAENALDAWIQAMRATKTFRIARRDDQQDPRFKGTFLWYPATEARGEVTRPVSLPLLETATLNRYPTYDEGAVAFLTHRRHLAVPPTLTIEPEKLRQRELRFLDHGNEFLGQLCDTLAAHGRAAPEGEAVAVVYPPGHPLAAEGTAPMLVACALERLVARELGDAARAAIVEGCTNDLDSRAVLRRLDAGLAADARWMRWQRPARFALAGMRLETATDTWVPMSEEACIAALDPRGEDKTVGRCHPPTPAERRRVPASAGGKLAASLSTALPALGTAALASRKALIEANLAHELRVLTHRKPRDIAAQNLDSAKKSLDQRYDAQIEATRRAARMRCLLLEKGWQTARETRHLAIHPRSWRDD